MLICYRDKRVEKLEKRLKWMEDQLKCALEDKAFEAGAESRKEQGGLATPSPDQSQAGSVYSTHSIPDYDELDSAFTVPEVSLQAPNFREPFQKRKFKIAMLNS
jgi:hypothetical protein